MERTLAAVAAVGTLVLLLVSSGSWGPAGDAPRGVSTTLGAVTASGPSGSDVRAASGPAVSPVSVLAGVAGAPTGVATGNLSRMKVAASLAQLATALGGRPAAGVIDRTLETLANGTVPYGSAFLPNLALLEHPVSNPASVVSPTYTAPPAPMGLADLGLSADGPYTVAAPEMLGEANLTGYNASAGTLFEDTGAYYWDGLSPNTALTPWQSGLQFNTVVTNVSYPGSNTGVFWVQNVLEVQGGTARLIDNVWNLSAPGAGLEPGTLRSFNGTLVPGSYYYDHGPTVPLTFPATIDLYNNASTVGGRSVVTLGFRLSEGPRVYTSTYDTVVFNSEPGVRLPLLTPEYRVDGSVPSPFGLLYDAELVVGGPGAGSNAVVASLNGTFALRYGNGVSWEAPRAAYDFGVDTGETAIGFAATWAGTTESVVQGPSLLYGLWNTSGGVPAGRDFFSADLAPTYGFAFVGPAGTADANLSYAPSAANGTVWTWLPPSDPPATGYNLTAFADGFDQLNATFSFGAPPPFPLTLTLSPQPGTWNAPLYLDGEDQATAVALNATGSAATPFQFANLEVRVNLTFNHLNDYHFPEFGLFWAYGVTTPFVVTNVSQGPDTPSGRTLYLVPTAGGIALQNFPNLASEFADWGGVSDVFRDLSLQGALNPIGVVLGGTVSLWNAPGASAYDLYSSDYSFGVWAADSTGLSVTNSSAREAGYVASLLDCSSSVVSGVAANDALDVFSEGGSNGTFVNLRAVDFGIDVLALDLNRTTVESAVAGFGALYGVYLVGGNASTIENLTANEAFFGLIASDASDLRVENLTAYGVEAAAAIESATGTTVSRVSVNDSTEGLILIGDQQTWVNTTSMETVDYGIFVASSNATFLSNVTAGPALAPLGWGSGGAPPSCGLVLWYANRTVVEHLAAADLSLGLYSYDAVDLNVTGLNATSNVYGALVNGTLDGTWTGVDADHDGVGLELAHGTQGLTIRDGQFENDSGFGVDIAAGTSNRVYNNSFAGDNGATVIYSPAHTEAYSVAGNWFNSSARVGNRWADWHSYAGPHLNPYPISNGVADDYPIGPIAYELSFTESGIPVHRGWWVGAGGSLARARPGALTVDLWLANGTYPYVIAGAKGYVLLDVPPSGNLTVSGPAQPAALVFARGTTRTLAFDASGLIPGTAWCVTVGASVCSTGGTVGFANLTPAIYPYTVSAVIGYASQVTEHGAPVPSQGTVRVVTASETMRVKFEPLLYSVTFRIGEAPASALHVTVACTVPARDRASCDGMRAGGATVTGVLTVDLRNGTYTWKLRPVKGYYVLEATNQTSAWGGSLAVVGESQTVWITLAQN